MSRGNNNNNFQNVILRAVARRISGFFGRNPQNDNTFVKITIILFVFAFCILYFSQAQAANVNFTLEAWVYPSTSVASKAVIVKNNELRLFTDDSGYLVCQVYNGTSWQLGATSSAALSLSAWQFVGCAYDGSSIRVFINGEAKGQQAMSANVANTSNSVLFGRDEGGTYSYFQGQIDDVKIYKTARTAEQIRRDYESGPPPVAHWRMDENNGLSIIDNSGNNNTGTLTNGPTWTNGKYGSALKFDGTDDYVEAKTTPTVGAYQDVTVSLWVKRTSVAGGDKSIVSKDWVDDRGINLRLDDDNTILVRVGSLEATPAGSSWSANVWQHHTLVLDRDGNAQLYLNGVPNGSLWNISSVANTELGEGEEWVFGAGYNHTMQFFNGLIDDIRIYNYARTQKQILEDMNASHPAVGSPVGSYSAYWSFDEGYGTTTHDKSVNKNNGVLYASTSWATAGKYGKALSFNGTTDYVDIGTGPTAVNTVSFWVYPQTTTEYPLDLNGTAYVWFNGGAITAQGFTSPTIYVNGVQKSSITAGAWQHIVVTTDTALNATDLDIGRIEGVGYFEGKIDEVKIYPFALSPAEIKLEYNRGTSLKLGSTGGGSDSVTSTESDRVTYCVPGDTSQCDAPVAHWTMNEKTGQYANDISSSQNVGTLGTGATADASDPTWKSSASCKSGSCLSFDGSNDYVSVGSNLDISSTNAVSISVWVYPRANVLAGTIITQRDTNTFGQFVLRQINSSGSIEFYICDTSCRQTYTSTAPNLNQWVLITVIWDKNQNSGKPNIYYNGIEQPYSLQTAATGNLATKRTTILGLRSATETNLNQFNGLIDDVRIYNYARTPAQIAWDYNRGKPVAHWKMDDGWNTAATCDGTGTTVKDASGNANTGTLDLGGSPATSSAWSEGKYVCAIDFDGDNDFVDVGAGPTAVNSVAFWVYPQTTTEYPLDLNGTAYVWFNGGAITAQGFTSPTIYVNGVQKSTITAGAWQHIVITTATALNATDLDLARIEGVGYFEGKIDDARLYNYVLTTEQIKTLYNENAAVHFGPAEGLP